MTTYTSGFGLPAEALFDASRAKRLFGRKWFFVGTRGDVAKPRDYLTFAVFDDQFILLHGDDGQIRCFVNRCVHQSARLLKDDTGSCSARLVCPNHQWTYDLTSGNLRSAAMMGPNFTDTAIAKRATLAQIPLREVSGMLFASLEDAPDSDLAVLDEHAGPYTNAFGLGNGGYKLAAHHREIVPANWLLIMINNRECCHCRVNHKGLTQLFDPSSFNGARSAAYDRLFDDAIERWEALQLPWREQAFEPFDCLRIARYPMREGYQSITFDGEPACQKPIGPFESGEASTLSIWWNPNAWIHFTSDHIATNHVLPLDATRSVLYSSWVVHEDAVEGVDYEVDHLTDVWRVTNAEDVELCNSMTVGAQSSFYEPGPFSPDERFCTQFCDWYMLHSA